MRENSKQFMNRAGHDVVQRIFFMLSTSALIRAIISLVYLIHRLNWILFYNKGKVVACKIRCWS